VTSVGEGSTPTRRRGRPPGQRSEETRARILRAARVRFGRCGYARTSLADIAATAEITPRAIYHYVESKPALFAEAAAVVYARFAQEIEARVLCRTDTRGRVHGLVDVFRALYAEDPSLVAFLSLSVLEADRNPELAEALPPGLGDHVGMNRALVTMGLERGEIAPDIDPDGAVALIQVFGAGLTLIANGERGDEYLAMLDVMDRLLDGTVFVRPSGAST